MGAQHVHQVQKAAVAVAVAAVVVYYVIAQRMLYFRVSLWQQYRPILWQYGLWSFQTGGTKLERFLPKNQHTQRKLLNFENWVSGEVSKSAKSPNLLTFKVNFLYQKSSESFSIFISLKNINLKAQFLLLTLITSIFKSLYLLK